MATEEASYEVTLKEGAFEIREYPELLAAEVRVGGDRQEAARTGFRLLADYIFGGNVARQRIAMTAPVLQLEKSEDWLIRFLMPRALLRKALPKPNDPKVSLVTVPATRYASVRFSGNVSPQARELQSVALRGFVRKHGLEEAGLPSLAQYNPPWIPWFLRRNEILMPLEASTG